MNDKTAIVTHSSTDAAAEVHLPMADAAAMVDEYVRATKLAEYHEGRRPTPRTGGSSP